MFPDLCDPKQSWFRFPLDPRVVLVLRWCMQAALPCVVAAALAVRAQYLYTSALRCPPCPVRPACRCSTVSCALTCARPASTGAISGSAITRSEQERVSLLRPLLFMLAVLFKAMTSWQPVGHALVRFKDDLVLLHHRLLLRSACRDRWAVAMSVRDVRVVALRVGDAFSEVLAFRGSHIARGVPAASVYRDRDAERGVF